MLLLGMLLAWPAAGQVTRQEFNEIVRKAAKERAPEIVARRRELQKKMVKLRYEQKSGSKTKRERAQRTMVEAEAAYKHTIAADEYLKKFNLTRRPKDEHYDQAALYCLAPIEKLEVGEWGLVAGKAKILQRITEQAVLAEVVGPRIRWFVCIAGVDVSGMTDSGEVPMGLMVVAGTFTYNSVSEGIKTVYRLEPLKIGEKKPGVLTSKAI